MCSILLEYPCLVYKYQPPDVCPSYCYLEIETLASEYFVPLLTIYAGAVIVVHYRAIIDIVTQQ